MGEGDHPLESEPRKCRADPGPTTLRREPSSPVFPGKPLAKLEIGTLLQQEKARISDQLTGFPENHGPLAGSVLLLVLEIPVQYVPRVLDGLVGAAHDVAHHVRVPSIPKDRLGVLQHERTQPKLRSF